MNKNFMGIMASVFFMSLAALAAAQDTNVTLSVDGKPALALKVPAAAKVISANGYVKILTTNLTLHVWAVTNAKTVNEALPRVGEIIKSEFLNFKANAVMDMEVAGAPAKHVIGSGNEADDHDPGNAEVVLFVVGGHVFAGCVHGEADDAAKARPAMMAVLKTISWTYQVWIGPIPDDELGTLITGTFPAPILPQPDISFRNEVQLAIDHGLLWLQTNQNSNGWWSTPQHPALTALAVSAFMGNPSPHAADRAPETVARGYKFILANVRPDGGIYDKDDENYNTSICLMALLAAHKPEYDAVALRARQWIIGQQAGGKEAIGSPFDGGVGYGSSATGPHTDMNNTYTALEALYYSKDLAKDKPLVGARDLNWDAAIHFIERCQNLPSVNKEPWASDDATNKGGFIYFPGRSSAGTQTNADGRVAFRSYGTITYAGFLSYIYADLKRDDPRVTAAFDWLRGNYTLEENPGMGPSGYYYYLQMTSKALSAYGVNDLALKDGTTVDWRRQLVSKLMKLQRTDGSWKNENERWMERDPVLVTSYSIMALEIAWRGL